MCIRDRAGAEDLVDEGDTWQLTCDPSDLPDLRAALEEASIGFDSADVTMLPSQTVELADAGAAKAVLNVIDILDDHDDVQDVFSNFDIPDDIMQSMEASA